MTARISASRLISKKNLLLAWRRICTAQNLGYKRFYRHLLIGYELGLEENLANLHGRLKGSWTASTPRRVYQTKVSKLHRPISVLALEDLVVYQAVANMFADKLKSRREGVENRVSFSNILNRGEEGIFFTEDWRPTFSAMRRRASHHFRAGRRWVVFFDLSEFYETISHDELLARLPPALSREGASLDLRTVLRTWGAGGPEAVVGHGIPQGPQASDFLAECLMLPLDEAMTRRKVVFLRYVDDMRVMTESEAAARREAFGLEKMCRDLGCLPSGSKFSIRKVKSDTEILDSFGSSSGSREVLFDGLSRISRSEAERRFARVVRGSPPILGGKKSELRYLLYRAPKSEKILASVIEMLPNFPEHVDAMSYFLWQYPVCRRLDNRFSGILTEYRFHDYARGELWHLIGRLASRRTMQTLLQTAVSELKEHSDSLSIQWGVAHFLTSCYRRGLIPDLSYIRRLDPFVQSLIASSFPLGTLQRQRALIRALLKSKHPEPGLALIPKLVQAGVSYTDYALRPSDLNVIVRNGFRALNPQSIGRSSRSDPVSDLLSKRYGKAARGNWRGLLGKEYHRALAELVQAEKSWDLAPSTWLLHTNSFCQICFFALQRRQQRRRNAVYTPTHQGKDLRNYGVTLESREPFSRTFPAITDGLRMINSRRNHLPGPHPYEKKGGRPNKYLTTQEKYSCRRKAAVALAGIASLT